MVATTRYSLFTLYWRLLMQARPYWPHLVGLLLLSLLSSPIVLLTPIPLKIAVDSVSSSHPLPDFLYHLLPQSVTHSETGILVLAAGLFVTIALLGQLQELSSSLLSTYVGETLLLHFRTQLFRHVQHLSLAYHDATGTADSVYRIQYDTTSIQNIIVQGSIPFITSLCTLAGMIYITIWIDWQLALVALTVAPILFLLARTYNRRLRKQARSVKKLESSALSVVQEVLAAVRVVQAFGQEDREEQRFLRHASTSMRARIRLAVGQGIFGLLVGVTTAVGGASLIVIGMQHVRSGVLTLGELLVVIGYLSQLYLPLKTVSKKGADIQSSLASAERAFSLLDKPSDIVEATNGRPLARASGAVAFRKVCFVYDADHPVLHDISFHLAAGTRLGITGATGAGKTSLVSLLARFYDPTTGQVLLDGVDLRDYRLADLRSQFAIVLQEPVLFAASIAENIAYSRAEASHDDIVAAAKAANAHEFILKLPEGYETQVGERGVRLSGGERQRISLARAFLKDAPILILDEPTSSVDMKTEAMIVDAMERLMRGRTTYMIAHRLSTLEHCDARLEIENGHVVATTLSAPSIALDACASADLDTTLPERVAAILGIRRGADQRSCAPSTISKIQAPTAVRVDATWNKSARGPPILITTQISRIAGSKSPL